MIPAQRRPLSAPRQLGLSSHPSESTSRATETPLAISDLDPSAIGRPAATPAPLAASERVWVVADDEQAATLAARGHQIGETVIVATGDLRALPPQTREMIFGATEVELGPGIGEDAVWQLEVIRRGLQIPGGGLLMFDCGHRSPPRGHVRPSGVVQPRSAGRTGPR